MFLGNGSKGKYGVEETLERWGKGDRRALRGLWKEKLEGTGFMLDGLYWPRGMKADGLLMSWPTDTTELLLAG